VFPVSLAYTFTQGSFLSSFNATNEDWGLVNKGDRLPYLFTHQLTFNASVEHQNFDFQVSSKYNGAMRTVPGQGEIEAPDKIASNFIIDVSANYKINRYFTAFGSVNNLANEAYVVAHRPAGLRPGMPRSFLFGLKMSL
jgi:Fe(3+) dicitrate transport protein